MAATSLPQRDQSPKTITCRCDRASIPAPPGTTAQTSFTCRECCAAAMQRRKPEETSGVYYVGGPVFDSALRELPRC